MTLKLIKATKRYKHFTAVNGVDFTIDNGEIFGRIGQNGAGKTTTFRISATDLHAAEPMISLALLLLTVFIFYRVTLILYKRSVLSYASGGLIQKLKKMLSGTT
ncbi:MAG: ATP-binding cassette domain-containing protein [Solibacillus sp.]